MSAKKQPLGVFGAGWVGLVTGACFADLGHDVVVRDVVPAKIEELNAGRVPFHEPGLAELIERNRERLTFTLDLDELKAGAQIFFSCVDTPPAPSGEADLSAVWSVVGDLGSPENAILVMKSTVPVGAGESIRAELDAGVGYVSNPGVPLGGPRDRGLRAPGPDRDRRVRRKSTATGWPRSTRASKLRSCGRASPPRR